MSRCIKYNKGDKLGPCSTVYIKDVEPHITSAGKKVRKALFICSHCGKNFTARIADIKNGKTKSCGCLHSKQAKINGKKAIHDLTGQQFGELLVIEDSQERRGTNIKWKCKCSCGKIVNVDGPSLLRGYTTSCGCFQKKDVAQRITNNLVGQKFGLLTVLKDSGERTSHGNIKWVCQCDCGNIRIVPGAVLTKIDGPKSCGCLTMSKGELEIRKFLIDNNFKYIKEYSLPNKQRLDFFLPKLNIAIEYDGEQHFQPISFFGGQKQFDKQQKMDYNKNKYCQDNNIKLIRIPYTEYSNISEILTKELYGESSSINS